MSYQKQAIMPDGSYANRATSAIYPQPAQQARGHQDTRNIQVSTPDDDAMAAMMNSFSQAHLGVPNGNMATNAPAAISNPYPVTTNQYFYTQEGQLVYAPAPASAMYSAQTISAPQLPQFLDANYGNYAGALPYIPQAAYPGYLPAYSMVPYTPARHGYHSDRSESMHKEVPGLENRRGSYSTNESAPGTPYWGSISQRDHGAHTHIAAIDRSPIYSTPSPQQPHVHAPQVAKPLPYKNITIGLDIDGLVQQHPAIPHAVPAVFTPRESMRTLEQSLSNPIFGNRNVYIRGLHPNTDDETLTAYAARFGQIETSKAIIDTSTGACKGYVLSLNCS